MNVATLDELRDLATEFNLDLTDDELNARIEAGSSSNSQNRLQYLVGFFPEANIQQAIGQ